MSPWIMHRDPRFFDRPEQFDPDEVAREVSALAWAGLRAVQRPAFQITCIIRSCIRPSCISGMFRSLMAVRGPFV